MRITSLKKLMRTADMLQALIDAGPTNCALLAEALNARRVKRRRGEGAWTAQPVSKVLMDVRRRLKRELLPVAHRAPAPRVLTPERLKSLKRVVVLAVAGSKKKARADALKLGRLITRIKIARPFFDNTQVAAFLNSQGRVTARGKRWSAASVERVVRVYRKLRSDR